MVAGANAPSLAPIADSQAAFLTVNPNPQQGQFSSLLVGLQDVLNRGRDAARLLLHAAEGQLFERAVIEAADDAGLLVHVVEPKSIKVSAAVEGLRRSIGAPWQKDHKWATTAALAALAST